MINKLKQVYRVFFPKTISSSQRYEFELKKNKIIKSYSKEENTYSVTLLDGLKLFIRDYEYSDYMVFNQIFNFKEYNIVEKMLSLNKNSNKEIVIIDAGANVGYTSAFFLNELKNCKIFGIEPSFENCEIYHSNVKNFNNITIYQNALSEKPNMFYSLDRNFRDGKDWSIATKESDKGEIKGISIAEIISENKLDYISFLKIDIEGAERFIFKNENDLSFLKITKIIAIEIHDEYNCRETICEILLKNNFYLFESGELTIGINKNEFCNG